MEAYLDIVKKVLKEGKEKDDRTGTGTIAIAGAMFEHDMSKGFPLLTTKNIPFRLVSSELEFFIKGISDKKWLIDRNNHIWDEWCSPDIIPYAHDEKTKKKMMKERDLGPLYGWQWRHFGAKYGKFSENPLIHYIKKSAFIIKNLRFPKGYEINYSGRGVDQLKKNIKKLKTNPTDRRMITMAWNPVDVESVNPPFCHYGFQVNVIGNKLNLMWSQRSCDIALGVPFNIASYALMLHLLAKETGLKEGKLVGFLADTHIYKNHIEGLEEQISRKPTSLPSIKTDNFTSIFDWQYTNSKVIDYNPQETIEFDIAV